jgi:hypothetical protein
MGMTTEQNELPEAKHLGVASRLRPPPETLDEPEDGSPDDPFAPLDAWPDVPLPPRPSRSAGSAICEAPRLSDGMVYLSRTSRALDWRPGDELAVEFDIERRRVVVRPGAYPLAAYGQGTVGMWSGLGSDLDRRRRVRLPPPALMALGVAEGGLLLAFGRQLPKVARDADGQRSAVLLMPAQDFQPLQWMEQLEW